MDQILPDKENLPLHVGIIMDGNGRWAKLKKQIRSKGHYAGLQNAKVIAGAAAQLGIRYMTLYVFSTENWKRTAEEVDYLMNLIRMNLRKEFNFYKANKIRLKFLGNKDEMPKDIKKDMEEAEKDTKDFSGLTLCLAINYGGKDEIKRAVQKLVSENVPPDQVTEEKIREKFDVPELPPCDLMIRTGGEKRLSNFLLWDCAYAEFVFTETLWPDYNIEEFHQNILEFQNRNRRFGDAK